MSQSQKSQQIFTRWHNDHHNEQQLCHCCHVLSPLYSLGCFVKASLHNISINLCMYWCWNWNINCHCWKNIWILIVITFYFQSNSCTKEKGSSMNLKEILYWICSWLGYEGLFEAVVKQDPPSWSSRSSDKSRYVPRSRCSRCPGEHGDVLSYC